jgi:hypothetical protein
MRARCRARARFPRRASELIGSWNRSAVRGPHRREDVTIAGSDKFSINDQCVEGQRLRGGGLVDRLEQPRERVELDLRRAHRQGAVLATDARHDRDDRARVARVRLVLGNGARPRSPRRARLIVTGRNSRSASAARNAATVAGAAGIA